ncbi:MAG: 2Fe-2S iron-sulfur cluster-binding protein [Burkholderiaceae bacterium]
MPDAGKCFQIVITPGGWQVPATDAMTILDAAIIGEVRLPSSCRNGTCRTCMCRLTEGQVSYRIDWPGLSADEKRDGYILPCVAYPESDLVIENPYAVSQSDSHA